MTANEIKRIAALRVDKFRKQSQTFLAEGPKMLEELLKSDYEINSVYALPEWIEQFGGSCPKNLIIPVSPKELSRISQLKTPNNLVIEVVMKNDAELQLPSAQNEWIVALDNINNPGNLGTIIRTADWFGIRSIVCASNCADFYNSKVIQSSMGSFTRINIRYTDLFQWLKQESQQTPVYGALMDGDSLYQTSISKNGILLIGNESRGISAALRPLISHSICIPTYGGGAESLNASIATAIILAEIKKTVN